MKEDLIASPKESEPIRVLTSLDHASVHAFLDLVEARLSEDAKLLQIDCADLTRVTSSHINSLWLAREKCHRVGAKFELVNVNEGLRRVLEAMDLATIFIPKADEPLVLSLTIAPTVAAIDQSMSSIVAFLTKSGLPEATAFELQTIFYEVATNTRRHGELAKGAKIAFEAVIRAHLVTFRFIDEGKSFDPTKRTPKVEFREEGHEEGIGGFGLAMIGRLSDQVEYSRLPGNQNQLVIEKRW